MVPTNIFQDVPFEIFEYIFDVLAHDDATLSTIKTCSLVSPYFLPLARKHIFASITLNDTSPRKLSPTSLMFEGLISVTPEIANHIHKLDYTVHYHDIAIKGLPSALKKITNLQSLVIKKAQFSARNGKPLKEALLYLLSLPTLSHLSLNSINDFHPSFLKLSIGLKFLETGGIQFASGRGYNNSSVLDPPQLQKYSDCSTESDVLKQLFTARRADGKPIVDFSRLKYLTVTIYETFSEAKALFKQCALVAQLTDVRIYRRKTNLSLKGFADMVRPFLRTLRHIHFYLVVHEDSNPIEGLAHELEKIAERNNIESISIELSVSVTNGCRYGKDWTPLDQALGRSRSGWDELKTVSLLFSVGGYDCQEMAGWNKALLDGLNKLPETQFIWLTGCQAFKFDFEVKAVLQKV